MKTKNNKNLWNVKKLSLDVFGLALMGFIFLQAGCKKLVDAGPPVTKLTTESAFMNDYTAISVLTGQYAKLSNDNLNIFYSIVNASKFTGLSSDELTLAAGNPYDQMIAHYTNSLFTSQVASVGGECWQESYGSIYTCNTIIEHVSSSSTLSPMVKKQLLGEAKFLRALHYFYLANLFNDVPLVLSTDYNINKSLPRTSKDKVYQQVISDLKESKELLSADFLNGGLVKYPSTPERVRPTKWAASALLARVYLYDEEWTNAEFESSELINNTETFGLDALNNVFKKSSREAIWQLQPVISTNANTGDGGFFILSAAGPDPDYHPVYLSDFQLNAFEAGDLRKVMGNWINSVDVSGTTYFYPFKYKLGYGTPAGSEYLVMFRLGEQYLIRAEARAQLGNVNGARDDLFAIRRRAGLNDITLTASDQTSLLTAILHERQVELFTEGHRWFDLKRTGNIDAIMTIVTPLKGGTWEKTDKLYPIPFIDIQRNANLTQNAGY